MNIDASLIVSHTCMKNARETWAKALRLLLLMGVGAFLPVTGYTQTSEQNDQELVNIHRLWNGDANWRDHFYTTSAAEAQNARDNIGFAHEGLLGKCYPTPAPNTDPLFRLYHTVNKRPDHFYTTSVEEKDRAIAEFNYRLEGILCWVPRIESRRTPAARSSVAETVAEDRRAVAAAPEATARTATEIPRRIADLIAEWQSRPQPIPVYRLFHSAPDHFYTTSWDEAVAAVDGGWRYEGIAFYVYPPDPCPKECQPGPQVCHGQSVRMCVEDVNLCSAWTHIADCEERCFAGACRADCDHECTNYGAKACVDGHVKKCVRDALDCGVWSTTSTCSNGCRDARCLRTTCSGDVEKDGAQTFVLLVSHPSGCGATFTAFANDQSEASSCATNAGWQVENQMCSYLIQVEPNYQTEVIAASQSKALNCVRNTVCSNCDLEVVAQGGCIQQ